MDNAPDIVEEAPEHTPDSDVAEEARAGKASAKTETDGCKEKEVDGVCASVEELKLDSHIVEGSDGEKVEVVEAIFPEDNVVEAEVSKDGKDTLDPTEQTDCAPNTKKVDKDAGEKASVVPSAKHVRTTSAVSQASYSSDRPACANLMDLDDEECSICLDAFDAANPSTPCECGHGFHFQCVEEWRQRSTKCPVCWNQLRYEDKDLESCSEAVNVDLNEGRVTAYNTTTNYDSSPSQSSSVPTTYPITMTRNELMQMLLSSNPQRRNQLIMALQQQQQHSRHRTRSVPSIGSSVSRSQRSSTSAIRDSNRRRARTSSDNENGSGGRSARQTGRSRSDSGGFWSRAKDKMVSFFSSRKDEDRSSRS